MRCEAGALLAASSGEATAGIPVLTRVNDVRFKQLVRPGDSIAIFVQREDQLSNATFFAATIKLGKQLAASLRFAAMVRGTE